MAYVHSWHFYIFFTFFLAFFVWSRHTRYISKTTFCLNVNDYGSFFVLCSAIMPKMTIEFNDIYNTPVNCERIHVYWNVIPNGIYYVFTFILLLSIFLERFFLFNLSSSSDATFKIEFHLDGHNRFNCSYHIANVNLQEIIIASPFFGLIIVGRNVIAFGLYIHYSENPSVREVSPIAFFKAILIRLLSNFVQCAIKHYLKYVSSCFFLPSLTLSLSCHSVVHVHCRTYMTNDI